LSRVTAHRPDFAVRPLMALGQEKKVYELHLKQWSPKGVPREFEDKNIYIKV
jgi:hypothetical protein